MFGPNLSRVGCDRFVAILMRRRGGGRIDAQMRLGIDKARRHPLAATVDARIALGNGKIGAASHDRQIGRESCRERVGQYVVLWVVAVAFKKKRQDHIYL